MFDALDLHLRLIDVHFIPWRSASALALSKGSARVASRTLGDRLRRRTRKEVKLRVMPRPSNDSVLLQSGWTSHGYSLACCASISSSTASGAMSFLTSS